MLCGCLGLKPKHKSSSCKSTQPPFVCLPLRASVAQVVVTEATLAAADAARAAGRSTWRVSSTVFTHCCSDALLRPLGRFGEQAAAQQQPQQQQPQQQQQQEAVGGAAGEAAGSYPAMKAGEQVGEA